MANRRLNQPTLNDNSMFVSCHRNDPKLMLALLSYKKFVSTSSLLSGRIALYSQHLSSWIKISQKHAPLIHIAESGILMDDKHFAHKIILIAL
jgi:hypothetical protein